jgi:hypothetical protein
MRRATRLWLRLRVWQRRSALTAALAAGIEPDADPALTRLAHELIGAPNRVRVADALDRILRDAAEPPRPWTATVPLNRREILVARDELGAVVTRLRAPQPVPVRGMALAERLLRDGRSPLYDREARDGVWRLARTTQRLLDDPIGFR